jgi:hypothetical protein
MAQSAISLKVMAASVLYGLTLRSFRSKLRKEHEVQRLHPCALVPVALFSKRIIGIAAPIPQCPQGSHAKQFKIKGGHIFHMAPKVRKAPFPLKGEQVININGGQVLVALA